MPSPFIFISVAHAIGLLAIADIIRNKFPFGIHPFGASCFGCRFHDGHLIKIKSLFDRQLFAKKGDMLFKCDKAIIGEYAAQPEYSIINNQYIQVTARLKSGRRIAKLTEYT